MALLRASPRVDNLTTMNQAPATKFTRILLAVDSSEHSMATVAPVAALAAATGAKVHVLAVWNTEAHSTSGRLDIETPAEARTLVDAVASLITEGGVAATTQVDAAAKERIPAAIVAAAADFGADLIAVGSRGIDDLRAALFGSVSQRVLHDSDCPVLVIRPSQSNKAQRGVRRVLVAVGGHEDAETAAAAARAVALSTGAAVMVVHVRYFTAAEGSAWIEPGEEAQELVDGVVRQLTAAGVKAEGKITMPSSRVAPDITGLARDWDADLIVMGSRRPSRLSALFGGSINHQVIHAADRPVLVAERMSIDNHRGARQ